MKTEVARRSRRALPGYLKHRSGQARVILGGKTHYLGKFGTPESHEEYSRLIREWEKNDRQPLVPVPDAQEAVISVGNLIDEFWRWVETTGAYRKNGVPTSAHARTKASLESLREFAGALGLRALSKQTLVVFRDHLCSDSPRTMIGVNKTIQIVKRMVAWGAERGMVQEMQAMLIGTLKAIREAPRKKPPVPLENLLKTIRKLEQTAPVVADMVKVQFLLGCRPGEVRLMRWANIDRAGVKKGRRTFWLYTVQDGKTRKEVYPISPEAQAILLRHEKDDATEPVFTPHDQARVTGRDHALPYKTPRPYERCDYLQCVRRAAKRAKVPAFGVHQIRHTSLSLVANDKRGGIGAAAALANHASHSTTARFYASCEAKSAMVGAELLQGRLKALSSKALEKTSA